MHVENRNAPQLWGWAVGAGLGLFAFAVAMVGIDFRFMAAALLGAVVFLVAGLILGMPWGQDVDAPVVGPSQAPVDVAQAPVTTPVAGPVTTPVAAPVAAPVAEAVAEPVAASAPVAEPAAEAVTAPSEGPLRLTAPRDGKADNLKEIEGIGPALERLCNDLGFWHFDQIASWSEADVAWVDANMKNFKGRIQRDKWVAQARLIVTEGLEAFRERARTNDY